MRKIGPSLLLIFLLVGQAVMVRAQEPLVLEVSVGFADVCRNEAWCPVRVVAANTGDDVEGELRVLVRERRGLDASRYRQSVTLPANSRKAYTFYLPPGRYLTSEYPRVELVENGRVIASASVPLQHLPRADRFYVTVGAAAGELSFLGDVEPGGSGDAQSVDVALADLPEEPLAWENFDVLVLRDVDTQALSAGQRAALRTWLQHGGQLVLGGGPGAAATLSGLGELAPVAFQGTTSLDRLSGLLAYVDVPVAEGPFAVAVTTLRDAGTLVLSQQRPDDRLILVARRSIGKGAVKFLAFDPALNPFRGRTARIDFWRNVLGSDLGLDKRPAFKSGYILDQALSVIPGVQILPAFQVLGFLVAYTVLIGPINYLILRRLDRREFAWLTVPLLALVFSALAYFGGVQLRGGKPIVHRLMIVNVPVGAEQGRALQAVGLFSPRRRAYTLESESAHVTNLRASDGGAAGEALMVGQTVDGANIEEFRVDVGGLRAFAVESYVEAPDLTSDLNFSVEAAGRVSVTGWLRNDGARAWKDIVLVVGTQAEALGDLGPQAEKRVALRLTRTTLGTGPNSFADRVFYNDPDRWSNPTIRRRYNLLLSQSERTYQDWGGPEFGTGAYLLAWQESELPDSVTVAGMEAQEFVTGLYIYALPVVMPGRLQTGEIIVPPALFTWEYEQLTGNVESTPEGFYLFPESALTLTFTPIPQFKLGHPEELTLQMTEYAQSSHLPPPDVALWNYEAAAWEQIEVGWGEFVLEDPVAYVSDQGEVHCRLSVGAGWGPGQISIPALTLTGR